MDTPGSRWAGGPRWLSVSRGQAGDAGPAPALPAAADVGPEVRGWVVGAERRRDGGAAVAGGGPHVLLVAAGEPR